MRKGDVYWVDLEPVRGRESSKTRPAVIVSNDAANRAAERRGGLVTVVPVTSNVDRVFPFQVRLIGADCGLAADSKAQAEQVRTVARERLCGRIGSVPAGALRQIDDALRLHLGL